jgi:hypothetical protein
MDLLKLHTYNESLRIIIKMKVNCTIVLLQFFPYDLKDMCMRRMMRVYCAPLHLEIIYWRSLRWRQIEKEELGKDNVMIFDGKLFLNRLCRSFYWPRSMELSRTCDWSNDIDELSDKTVGKDNTIVFDRRSRRCWKRKLLKDHKYNVNSINPKDIRTNLKEFSIKTFVLIWFWITQFQFIFQ